jgi:hypothetical protein
MVLRWVPLRRGLDGYIILKVHQVWLVSGNSEQYKFLKTCHGKVFQVRSTASMELTRSWTFVQYKYMWTDDFIDSFLQLGSMARSWTFVQYKYMWTDDFIDSFLQLGYCFYMGRSAAVTVWHGRRERTCIFVRGLSAFAWSFYARQFFMLYCRFVLHLEFVFYKRFSI